MESYITDNLLISAVRCLIAEVVWQAIEDYLSILKEIRKIQSERYKGYKNAVMTHKRKEITDIEDFFDGEISLHVTGLKKDDLIKTITENGNPLERFYR